MSYKDVDGLLLELFKESNVYHHSKDNLIWIIASFYFTSIGSLFIWLYSNDSLCNDQKSTIKLIMMVFSIFIAFYLSVQTWYKAKSAYRSKLLARLFVEKEVENNKTIEMYLLETEGKARIKEKLEKYLKLYKENVVKENNIAVCKKIDELILIIKESNKERRSNIVIKILCSNGKLGIFLAVIILLIGIIIKYFKPNG